MRVFQEVKATEQLIVIESQDVVHNVLDLIRGQFVFQNAICIKLWLLHASTEETHPFLTQVKWVELVANVFLRNILEEKLKKGALERSVKIDTILYHAHVYFGGVSCGFGRVVL